MKNLTVLFGIVAAVVVIMSAFVACDDESVAIFNVTYDGNGNTGGTAPMDSNSPYKIGTSVTVLGNTGNLIKTEYTFIGWNTVADGSGTTYETGAVFAIIADITLYAKWIPLPVYTVTFDADDGTPAPVYQDIIQGGTVIEPPTMTRDGYIFIGWYQNPTKTTMWDFTNSTVITTITLYAKWTPLPIYTVSFIAGSGTPAPVNQNIMQGDTVTKPSAMTRNGYTFDGWYQDSDRTIAWDFTADTVTANITLYAKWTPLPVYIVTFDADNGISAPADQNIMQGGKITNPPFMTRNGYTFDGWYQDFDRTIAWDFASNTVFVNVTLYAKWIPLPVYTVTFNADDGTPAPVNQDIIQGGTITRPSAMTKSGYTFIGWYNEPDFSTAWDFPNNTVTGNITLYAKWVLTTYTVTFSSNGGSTVQSQTVNPGSTITRPENPTRDGYNFSGWYTTASGTSLFDINWPITENRIVYAKWTCNNTYKVGDIGPGGGIVFYVSSGGFSIAGSTVIACYLEAASNAAGTFAWASPQYINRIYGGTGDWLDISGTSQDIGTGRRNTAIILTTDPAAPAAKACNEYNGGGKADWFLPSTNELLEIYRQRSLFGGISSSGWSSSQNSRSSVFYRDSNSPAYNSTLMKHNQLLAWPIRAF